MSASVKHFTAHPSCTRNCTLASKGLIWDELTLLCTLLRVRVLVVRQSRADTGSGGAHQSLEKWWVPPSLLVVHGA